MRVLFLFLFLVFGLFLKAIPDSTWFYTNKSTSNIIDLSDKLNLHVYGKIKYTDLMFICEDTSLRLVYSPNDQLNMGLGFNWKFLGLGLAFNFKFFNDDDLKYGDTKRLDLQLNAYGRKSVVDITFYTYSSFYLKNIQEQIPSWNDEQDQYIRPDINTMSFGLSYLYLFNNEKFSYRAAFLSNAQQLKSAGSFFLGGQISAFKSSADSSFFPALSLFDALPNMTKVSRTSIGVNFGYAYNLILPLKMYISATLAFAPAIGHLDYKFLNSKKQGYFLPSMDFIPRFALGYNGDIYYFGFSHVSRMTTIELKQKDFPNLAWQNGNYRFFFRQKVLDN